VPLPPSRTLTIPMLARSRSSRRIAIGAVRHVVEGEEVDEGAVDALAVDDLE
jgi:hypothetical protein